ncbi:MAG: hypothetical protein EXQ50_08055 [Acidobacteria bacterium]|nr:hypothetical protein [Acidobacteriota bacterium]MSO62027.1 hypothetical protein [Acidobacteriota bacterium]
MIGRHTATLFKSAFVVAGMVSMLAGATAGAATSTLDAQDNKGKAKSGRGNLPPGLAKRRTLPPGLSRQLRERGTLPPGLRDYYTPVPAAWNPRFPAIPTYYQRYFVGSHLIVIDTRDNTLVSLIRDLLN